MFVLFVCDLFFCLEFCVNFDVYFIIIKDMIVRGCCGFSGVDGCPLYWYFAE